MRLRDNPGDEFIHGEGDYWSIRVSDYGFRGSTCVTYDSISEVAIKEGGNDGWNIGSIMTMLDTDGVYRPLTANFGVNRWIDGNGEAYQREYVLTKV